MAIDPYWDSLISNPQLREVYTRAEKEGYPTKQAHAIARIEVFGLEHARESFALNDDEEAFQKVLNAKNYEQEHGGDAGNDDKNERKGEINDKEAVQNDAKQHATLEDWADNDEQ